LNVPTRGSPTFLRATAHIPFPEFFNLIFLVLLGVISHAYL
jgi:hypothetical protein